MPEKKKLPVGIDNFEKIIKNNFYYVDKTEMIHSLIQNWSEVNLITRPRRFGKTLNMNMLQTFFEIGTDPKIFEGLKISEDREFCEKYMGHFPVISISLKNVEGMNFESACAAMKYAIGAEALRFSFLEKSPELSETDKKMYKALTMVSDTGDFQMSYSAMEKSLLTLSSLLCRHYGKKVILLIDEYDVPLDKAFQNGYYEEMVSLIRNMFGNVLKTNSNLYFAVLTGCLRIAKESIFTGLNNFELLRFIRTLYRSQRMVRRLSVWKHRSILPVGRNLLLQKIICRSQRQTGRLLVQYQWKRNCTKIYQQSRQSDKKRHRKTDRRRDCNKGNPPGTDI